MKNILVFICIVYMLLFVYGSIFSVEERTILLGGGATWRTAENRNGITELGSVRPHPVLALSSNTGMTVHGYSSASGVMGNFTAMREHALDLSISFDANDPGHFRDNTGNYRLSIPSDVEAAGRAFARAGNGAALFGRSAKSSPIIIQPQSSNALFSSGNRIRDFSIEFWIYPLNLENGEQIFSWVSSRNGCLSVQRITCTTSRNRIQWSFINFFTSVNGNSSMNIEFSGNTAIIPRTWSHHLIRFDASTGMVEYLINGSTEAIVYATASGRESSEVFTPVIGGNGVFLLGERFSGMMDEFKIHNVCVDRSSIQRYLPAGGRIETRAIDLGENNSGVIRVDATGGRVNTRNVPAGRNFNNNIENEYRENGRFRFSDDSEMNFFIRASENPYLLNNSRWENFTPGAAVSGIKGRYVQIAVDFYPSADGESSPYLEGLSVVFKPSETPLPPRNLSAIASDGSVMLRWRHSPASNTAGYLVYYSDVRGELFGRDALLGPSPIDVGITNNVLIEGLRNGTLYYFRVAAYDKKTGENSYNAGEFSAEVTARPLSGLILP